MYYRSPRPKQRGKRYDGITTRWVGNKAVKPKLETASKKSAIGAIKKAINQLVTLKNQQKKALSLYKRAELLEAQADKLRTQADKLNDENCRVAERINRNLHHEFGKAVKHGWLLNWYGGLNGNEDKGEFTSLFEALWNLGGHDWRFNDQTPTGLRKRLLFISVATTELKAIGEFLAAIKTQFPVRKSVYQKCDRDKAEALRKKYEAEFKKALSAHPNYRK